MKNRLLNRKISFLACFLLLITCFFACDPDDDLGLRISELECTIDGESFKSNIILAETQELTQVKDTIISITSTNLAGEKLIITLNDMEVGNYAINNFQNTIIFTPENTPLVNGFYSQDGSLGILEHDEAEKFVRGTFNFSAIDSNLESISVNSGSFQVFYND